MENFLQNMSQKPFILCILLNSLVMILEKFIFAPILLNSLVILLYFFLFHFPDIKINSPCEITRLEEDEEIDQTELQTEINRNEISFVMKKMGLNLMNQGDSMRNQDFSMLFEDSEPSLDEVKEAFSIFDTNKDGFIDAGDLQRVLINLGIEEDLDMKACQLMIEQHDRNRDGMIDLRDFSRLLETSLL